MRTRRGNRSMPMIAALIACLLPAACSTGSEASSGSVASTASVPASTAVDVTLEADAPQWVVNLARTIQRSPVENPPLSIWRYEYNAETVYYVPPRCCDEYSDLYNSSGKIICHPDGGLSGQGHGPCVAFLEKRRAEKRIWRDPRAR